tara:strand:- start:2039 stop:2686 length:648 start_codon:yes stop_codon:yes gene_type:complete
MKPTPELLGVLEQWNKAEKAIKVSEQITGQVAIPSVMELRYAGRRVVVAFNSYEVEEEEDQASQYLVDAKFDCLRAQHDALDISVNYIAAFVDEVLRNTEPFALEGHYDELNFFIEYVAELQEKVVKSREDRSNREQYYDDIHESLSTLQTRFQTFKVSLVGMIKATDVYYKEADTRERVIKVASKAKRDERISLIASVVAAATAAVVTLISVLG